MIWTIAVLAVLALVLWSFYVSWRASRLDRLHNRVEAARTALDLALVRRASAASELASSGQLDPATSLLLGDAVRRAREAARAGGEGGERDLAESDLTRALRATVGNPEVRKELAADDGTAELAAEVMDAAQRVFIARKFYNDLAGRTTDARRRPLVRVLRLYGSAKQPVFFDMDDEVFPPGDDPRGLSRGLLPVQFQRFPPHHAGLLVLAEGGVRVAEVLAGLSGMQNMADIGEPGECLRKCSMACRWHPQVRCPSPPRLR